MLFVIKRLALGIILIVLASSLLLISDRNQRKSGASRIPRIAILQHASQPILDLGVQGMIDALADQGFTDGSTISIAKYNAENDIPTANSIAKDITSGRYDMVLTCSTLSLQAVANANRDGKTIQVFGVVADPFAAIPSLDRAHPLAHPRHLVGIGTLMPVASGFELAKRMFPGLHSAGVVWNPGEANSRVFTGMARDVCKRLGIELLEANSDNSSGVFEAASSLVSRGAQALWVGGDVTVLTAIDSLLAAAKRGRIPVFTVTPSTARKGGLFDVGANFYEVGRQTGELAAQILKGTDPSAIPIRDFVPRKIEVNTLATAGLKDPWKLPDDLIKSADVVIDQSGVHDKNPPPAKTNASRPLSKKWQLRLVEYVSVVDVEEAEHGVLAGLKDAGLAEGRDYDVKILNAQGDMATVNNLIDAAMTDGADMLITLSTPTLQAAVQRVKTIPVVFAYVADGVAAGAGRSDTDHLPNITGVYLAQQYEKVVALFRETFPAAKTVGTLFVPAEANNVLHKEKLEAAARNAGLQLITVPVSTATEVADAALSLCSQRIDAVIQVPGNLVASAFVTIAQAANRARLPIFAFSSSQARQGAVVVLSRDFFDNGHEAGMLAARVARGESPASLPFRPVEKTRLVVNLDAARALRVNIPPSIVSRADEVIGR